MPYCFQNFVGIQGKSDSFSEGYATIAENIDLSCGRLDPWRTPLAVASVPSDTHSVFLKQGKFRYAQSAGVSVVQSLTGMCFMSDPCDCISFRKDWCSDDKRALGLPRPPEPLLTSQEPPKTDADCWKPENTSAKITFKSRCGHYVYESQPSCFSQPVKASVEDKLCIDIPAFDPGKYVIDTVCVYLNYSTWDVSGGLHGYPALGRNLEGRAPEDVATNFETNVEMCCYKVAEVAFDPNGMKVFIEKDKCFGNLLITEGWRAPDPGLCLAGESLTGSLVAYDEYCLYFSVRNNPHAWRMADQMYFGSRIIYACHKGLQTYVFTEDCKMFIVVDDNDPAEKGSCRSVRQTCDIPKPCVSKFNADKATICGEHGIVYPSEEGVILVSPEGSVGNILPTDKNRFIWRHPISMARHRNQLFITGFHVPYVMSTSFLGTQIDRPNTLSTLSFCVDCFFEDCGQVYAISCGQVYKWDAGTECLPMRYKSNILRIQGLNLTTIAIEYTDVGANESVAGLNSVSTIVDGSVQQVKCLSDCQSRRIQRISNAKTFCFEYNGTASVQRICLGSSLQDLGVAQAA